MNGAVIIEGGDFNEQGPSKGDSVENEQIPHIREDNQEQPDVSRKCHGEAFHVYMRYFRDRISIVDYMHMRLVSRQTRDLAEDCIQVIAKKIKIAKKREASHQDVLIRSRVDREVLKAQMGDTHLTNAIRFFDKIGIRPILLDLTEFNHPEHDPVIGALSAFVSWKHISLCEKCNCYEDCMKISRFCLMTDIFAISPAAFMESKHGVNSLLIDALLPYNCVELLKERSSHSIGVRELFDVFSSSIHFYARVLYIKGTNRTPIEKRYFVAMMNRLRVEELIMYPESDEQNYQPVPGGLVVSPYSDMKFAQLPNTNPVEYWDDSDERIKTKVVSYTAVDRIPCTAVVEHLCSWFEATKEMLIIFPKPRAHHELLDDVDALCTYLKKFDYPLISLRFTVYKNVNRFLNLQRLFYEIRELLQNRGFLNSTSHFTPDSFCVEVESDHFFKKLRVTEIDPPPPPPHVEAPPLLRPRPHQRVQFLGVHEEDAVGPNLAPEEDDPFLDIEVDIFRANLEGLRNRVHGIIRNGMALFRDRFLGNE